MLSAKIPDLLKLILITMNTEKLSIFKDGISRTTPLKLTPEFLSLPSILHLKIYYQTNRRESNPPRRGARLIVPEFYVILTVGGVFVNKLRSGANFKS